MSSPNEEYWTMDTYPPEVKKANSARGVPFIYSTETDEQTAMQRLTGNGFKLWRTLVKNKHGESFFANAQKMREYTGMTEREYRGARDSLRENGFLVWNDKNKWTFHAKPQEPRTKPTKAQRAAQEKKKAEMNDLIADCASYISGGYTPRQEPPQRQQEARRKTNSFDYDGEPFDF